MTLADSHIHLDDPRFDADRDDVIARAQRHDVGILIVPGVDRSSWSRIATIAQANESVFPAYGLHPMFLAGHRPDHVQELEAWLDTHRAVAVGEIGLDYFIADLDRSAQHRYFDAQLAIANERKLPVIIHARRAVEQVLMDLRRHKGITGVVHSFSGSEEQARQLMDLGFCLGLGGPVTYPRAQRLHRIAAGMPIEYLMLESDAPDQPGRDQQGQRNEPCWLGSTLRHIAALRGESEASVAAATTANVERLFKLESFRQAPDSARP